MQFFKKFDKYYKIFIMSKIFLKIWPLLCATKILCVKIVEKVLQNIRRALRAIIARFAFVLCIWMRNFLVTAHLIVVELCARLVRIIGKIRAICLCINAKNAAKKFSIKSLLMMIFWGWCEN